MQAIGVQVLGVAFFFLLSFHATKYDFGIIGWANAVSMLAVTLLSFGMEQVVVRRIAASDKSSWAAAAFLIHALCGTVALFLLLYAGSFLWQHNPFYYYLPLFFASQGLIYIATPLKQFLNAKELFAPYGLIALISNLGKVIVLYVLLQGGSISVKEVGLILCFFGFVELVCLACYIYFRKDIHLPFTFRFSAYKKLLKESLPQYISAIFDSSLSRIDWILLGLVSTALSVAEYSFAYRAYEIMKLPLMVIGPVLLVKYSRMMANNEFDTRRASETGRFIVIALFLSVLMVIFCNVLWAPIVTGLTNGKYGTSNALLFFMLSLCLPIHFLISMFWTMCFAGKKYRYITRITIIVAVSNLLLNLALIPLLGSTGAALSYLAATMLQAVAYYIFVRRHFLVLPAMAIWLIPLTGIAAYAVSAVLLEQWYARLGVSMALYISGCLLFKQVRREDVVILKSYLNRRGA